MNSASAISAIFAPRPAEILLPPEKIDQDDRCRGGANAHNAVGAKTLRRLGKRQADPDLRPGHGHALIFVALDESKRKEAFYAALRYFNPCGRSMVGTGNCQISISTVITPEGRAGTRFGMLRFLRGVSARRSGNASPGARIRIFILQSSFPETDLKAICVLALIHL
ncbi:MAG: hypothetical protein EXR29_06140 [Betaproteobacteria bacterium]|nr:hypothetical protein [Betaproteobacteria bacterium]